MQLLNFPNSSTEFMQIRVRIVAAAATGLWQGVHCSSIFRSPFKGMISSLTASEFMRSLRHSEMIDEERFS